MTHTAAGMTLKDEIQTLGELKEKVSDIYKEMGDFIANTTDRIKAFREMMGPYVAYFYPSDKDSSDGSFITEVVMPSSHALEDAIDRSMKIMSGDHEMNDNISRAIENVLGLKESIDRILFLIDEIDIYSENTLIISTKYGAEGMSLARISNEMASMARQVNAIGEKFREYLNEMDLIRDDFKRIRMKIGRISEDHLAKMRLDLSMEFPKMAEELDSVSALVHGMLSGADEVEGSMRNLVTNIQMEDVIRQKLERIIRYLYYLDGTGNEEDSENLNSIGDVNAIVTHVSAGQLSSLESDVSWQHDEINGYCDRISAMLREIISEFYAGNENDMGSAHNCLEMAYRHIEDLREGYIRYLEEIISGKKRLLELCKEIIAVFSEFDGLFSAIGDTVKKFEALNMITRIELARHVKLSRTLGGTLATVKTLPAQMKQIVAESLVLYNAVHRNLIEAVGCYEENIRSQEGVLSDCIDSMKNMSVMLYESQKYYGDISSEVGKYCLKMLEFIESKCQSSCLFEARESIRSIMASMDIYRDMVYGSSFPDIEAMKRKIQDAADRNSAIPLVAALQSDFSAEKSKDQVIIF